MKAVKKTRIIEGSTYRLMPNAQGTSSEKADATKRKLKKQGYKSVRVLWSGAQPHVYPKGRFFVYAIKG